MDEIVVSTEIYLPPEEVYDFLTDFPRYARYSKHLTNVTQEGDGSPGTVYSLHFSWWKLTYVARSRVTEVDPPTRIDWRVIKDVDAHGCWRVEPLAEIPAAAPSDAEAACRVFFEIRFDPDTVDDGAVDLPMFVSLDWVIDRIKPLVKKEAERVVERIVADIEGRDRPVELTFHERPDEL